MAYLDTTIILPYYCPEKLSSRAEKIMLEDDAPTISSLTAVEVASALSRKIREKTLSPVHVKNIWKQFDYHQSNGYFIVRRLDDGHFSKAASFILQFNNELRTLDALHLAIAVENSLPIITADKALARSADKLGIECVAVG
jgi:predicted nucleic acid-binding protein